MYFCKNLGWLSEYSDGQLDELPIFDSGRPKVLGIKRPGIEADHSNPSRT
jgi:hypothetical protein